MRISAVLLLKNEEKRIRRCLDSVKDWVDEIVVVDDGSTDDTVRIVKEEYGAKVIEGKSQGHFAAQRNLGIGAAGGTWILPVDADEVVPKETIEKIKDVIKSDSPYAAYTLILRDCVFDVPIKHFDVPPKLRLFQRDKGKYSEKIHEVLEIDGKVGHLDADILHYNIDSIHQTLQKYDAYADLESEVFLEGKENISIKFLKGKLLFKTVRLFWKLYFKKKAYKDGVHGLIYAILHTLHPLIRWLKILERALKENKLT